MDDSEMAAKAFKYTLEAHPDAEITVLHVVGEPSSMWGGASGLVLADDLEEAAQEHAQDVHLRDTHTRGRIYSEERTIASFQDYRRSERLLPNRINSYSFARNSNNGLFNGVSRSHVAPREATSEEFQRDRH